MDNFNIVTESFNLFVYGLKYYFCTTVNARLVSYGYKYSKNCLKRPLKEKTKIGFPRPIFA